MTKNVRINPEFAGLIPPLTQDERDELERSIVSEGVREPIITWRGVIVDGHNRYEIATAHGIEFDTVEYEFSDESAVKAWMIHNQFARRNLSAYQRGELALQLKPIIAAEAKKQQVRKSASFVCQKSDKQAIDTKRELAKIAGVSHDTIAKVERIKRDAPEELRKQVERGEVSINAAYQQMKKPHVAHNSGQNEWYTPTEYIEAARATMGSIDVDPASSEIANKTVKAERYYTVETNGLAQTWSGNVWMNPPYSSDKIGLFVDKLQQELPNVNQATVLVNNATETTWFGKLVDMASAVCFPHGRVRFLDPDGNPGAPLQGQAVVYIGDEVNRFTDLFAQFGWVAEVR